MDLQLRNSGAVSLPRGRGESANRDTTMLARLIADGRLGRDIGVTCRGRTDGAGQQTIAVISAMMLARYADCRYLHSPFARLAHAEGTPEDWAARWEEFFNFGDAEILVPEDAEVVLLSSVVQAPEAYAGRPIVVGEPLFAFPELSPYGLHALRGELRAKYWRGPKASIPSHRGPAGGLTAAIHVRRGDVTLTQNAFRYVRDETVLRHIARLRTATAPFRRPLTINLYSEGHAADFRAFADAGCNLHISEDPFETLHNMVTADILVGAHSNFSYLAAILSDGIVLDHRRRPPQFRNWLGRRIDRDFSIRRLRQALLGQMGWLERQGYRARRLWRWQHDR